MNWYVEISDLKHLKNLVHPLGLKEIPYTLDTYVNALEGFVHNLKKKGFVGIKFLTAYNRKLDFAFESKVEAEKIYSRYFDESYGFRTFGLGFEETIPLQNYLTRRIIEFAGKADLPVIFHSGIHGTRHKQDNSRPLRLWNIFNKYTDTKFVLLHAGIPWVEEAATLAKNFPNVYLDMAWDHIISTEISKRAISTWVDMVPKNKIFGFGGDYSVIEDIYGHLQLAKLNIAYALESKINENAMTLKEALSWSKALLYDNPKQFYKI